MCMCAYKPENWHYSLLVTLVWVLRMSPCRSRANAIYVLPTCVSLSLSLWLWHNLPRCSLVFKPSRLRYPSLAFALVLTAFFVLCRCVKKNKLLLNMQVNGNGCEDSPSRYPVMPARTPGVAPAATTASYTLPGTPTLLEEHSTIKSESRMHFLFCWFSKYECHTTCKTVCYSVWSVKKLISRPMQQVVCGNLCLFHMYSYASSCVCVLRSTVTVTSPQSFHCKGITSQMWFHRVLVTTSKLLNPQFFMWLTT